MEFDAKYKDRGLAVIIRQMPTEIVFPIPAALRTFHRIQMQSPSSRQNMTKAATNLGEPRSTRAVDGSL
jgi:hypothetical protein